MMFGIDEHLTKINFHQMNPVHIWGFIKLFLIMQVLPIHVFNFFHQFLKRIRSYADLTMIVTFSLKTNHREPSRHGSRQS